jgi:hypothetical protein
MMKKIMTKEPDKSQSYSDNAAVCTVFREQGTGNMPFFPMFYDKKTGKSIVFDWNKFAIYPLKGSFRIDGQIAGIRKLVFDKSKLT